MEAPKILTGKVSRKNPDDAGHDIHAAMSVLILPGESASIPTNFVAKIPDGQVGLIKSRSGLSFNYNLEVGAGVIDSNYRGEIKVHLYNFGELPYQVISGNKVAQILVIPINPLPFEYVDSLDETERGSNGFGHSGK